MAEMDGKKAVAKRTVRKKSSPGGGRIEEDSINTDSGSTPGYEGGKGIGEQGGTAEETTEQLLKEDRLDKLEVMQIEARSGLNCRVAPGINQPIVKSFENGTRVYLLDRSEPDWYKVLVPYDENEYIGYCSSRFLVPVKKNRNEDGTAGKE